MVLVQDNLNIHSKASLYEAFPPAQARRLVERVAESELGCPMLLAEITAWEHDRNAHHAKSNWHFTTKDARIKLKHLYPSI